MYVFRTMNSLSTSFWIVPVELGRLHPLLLGGDDVEREHREHGAVHRHRHAHLVERDVVEQLAHVEDRVDGHAGHADVALHPGVVGVVAAVGRQVEGDGQALLAGGEVAAVEGVGLLGRREPGVLADRPRLVRVHRRVRAAQERREARVGGEEVEAVDVGSRVEGADVDALGRLPLGVGDVAGGRRPSRRGSPTPVAAPRSGTVREVRDAHGTSRRPRSSVERGADVGADVDRALDAGGGEVAEDGLGRPATYTARGAGAEQRRGDGDALLGVDRVAGAEARDGGAGRAERLGDRRPGRR